MMRNLLTFSLFLTALTVTAREITPREAANVASEFLNATSVNNQTRQPLAITEVTASDSANAPYYVFNAEGDNGFVIVSGNDAYNKILGYSDSGNFDIANIPPQLKAMLEKFTKRSENSQNSMLTHSSWTTSTRSVASGSGEGILLKTAAWGQGFPYNTECPTIEGEHALTGCVATAMAIVMKYHNWPEGYDWAAMPMNTPEDPIDLEENNEFPALAKIMHDAGEAVFMQYSLEESGAYLDWIGHRLQSVFHYSPDCQYIGGDHFEKEEWEKMLKGNLDKGNPVIYDGYGSGGHHAFIIDGYDSSCMYHVNWGWNGMDNGYYALDALEPADGWGFSEYNGMIMNIEPDYEKNSYSECFTDYGYLWSMGASTREAVMNVSVEEIKQGEPFHLFNSILTVTPGFRGKIGVAIVDKDGNIKEVLREDYRTTFSPGTNIASPDCMPIRFFDLIPTCEIASTDRLQLVSKHDDDDRYKLVLGTMEWPSSRPVVGNTPERSTIIFNIEDGLKCRYILDGMDSEPVSLPAGITEVSSYLGVFMDLYCEAENIESGNPLQLAFYGNMYGGDTEYHTFDQYYGIGLNLKGDKYEVVLRQLHLQEQNIHLDQAGTLKDKLGNVDGSSVGTMTISGKMNALDFWYIRNNCLNIQNLDLRDVVVEGITAGDGAWVPDDMVHPDNAIPYRALPGLVNLEKLILPKSLTSIEGFSLMSMKLTSLSIPEGVKTIGRDAFWNNGELQAVEVLNPEPPAFEYMPFDDTKCPANGFLFVPEGSKDKYEQAEIWKDFGRIIEGRMPDPLKSEVTVDGIRYECYIDEARVIGYEGELTDVVIPEKIAVNGIICTVTGIKEHSFYQCESIKSVVMPETVSEIGYYCFGGCVNLESVKLSPNITQIPYGAFSWCRSLKEFTLDNITYLGNDCLLGTGISKVVIPKTLIPSPYDYPFGDNFNLERFEVEEGHKYYKEEDGLLYRISEDGLVLESVPGRKSGVVSTAANCIELLRNSFLGCANIEGIILSDGLRTINTGAVSSNESLSFISIPDGVTIDEGAFIYNGNLEALTFNGTPVTVKRIFSDLPELKYVYVNCGEKTIDLNGLFEDGPENINIYNPGLGKMYEYSGNHTLFVPGGCRETIDPALDTEITEMWSYQIDRQHGYLIITPAIDGLVIDEVTINGRVVVPENGIYSIVDNALGMNEVAIPASDSYGDLDVTVEYTLHGYQTLSTHYSPEFNATIPDSIISGIENVVGEDSETMDIYSVDGAVIAKGADSSALRQLTSGIYVVHQGSKTYKIAVK